MQNLLLIALALGGSLVDAFPNSAGSCQEGTGAILTPEEMGGIHIKAEQVGTGSLMSGGFEFSLDGEILTEGTPASFRTGIPHNISLVATGDAFFRGFLIRMDSEDLTALTPVDPNDVTDLKVATQCTQNFFVPGVDHTNNNDKTAINAVLQLDEGATDLTLDVTVVVQHSRQDSINEWYYSGFTLSAFEPTSAPTITMSPMEAPSAAPSMVDQPTPGSKTDSTSTGAGLMVSVAVWLVALGAGMAVFM